MGKWGNGEIWKSADSEIPDFPYIIIMQGDPELVCGLHVLCFPGSAEKPLIAPRFGCLQCSEISDSAEEPLIGMRW